jgi:hypothetical protein
MPAGRLTAATGRHSTSAGKVAMAKTEQSMVVGRLTTPAGTVPVVETGQPVPFGKPPMPILRVTTFVGRLTAFVGKTAKPIHLAAVNFASSSVSIRG